LAGTNKIIKCLINTIVGIVNEWAFNNQKTSEVNSFNAIVRTIFFPSNVIENKYFITCYGNYPFLNKIYLWCLNQFKIFLSGSFKVADSFRIIDLLG